MTNGFRRVVTVALLAAVRTASAAVAVDVPSVPISVGLGAMGAFGAAPSALLAPPLTSPLAGALSAPALAAPTLSAFSATPALSAPVAALAAPSAAAFAAAPAAPVLAVSAAAPASTPAGALAAPAAAAPGSPAARSGSAASAAFVPAAAPALSDLTDAAAGRDRGGRRFDGDRGRAAAPVDARRGDNRGGAVSFVKNDEGVWVGGRVADQYREITRMYNLLSPHMDLSDTMNVMDDAYDEARAKLAAVEKAAHDRNVAASSVHLEETRTFVDAVLVDAEGRQIAEHTHRVYFHPADNADSEIKEGIRRVDGYIEEMKKDFAKGGRAEQEMNTEFDEVLLTFDVRGYQPIEDHLRQKEAELRAEYGNRFTFAYVNERPRAKPQIRSEYNRLVEKYKDQPQGVMNIIDGVTYSRYVGLLHELKSHEDSLNKGETVLQAGRDFFEEIPQPDGSTKRRYITEFDAVVRTKDGTIVLREDKSVRIPLPLDVVMQTTFLYKLEIYKTNRALIEKSLGAPLNVRFSVDVGGTMRKAARQGILVWNDPRQEALLAYLKTQGPILSEQYGFPVEFVFVNSHANEPPDLFYREPVSLADWQASQGGFGSAKQAGRKHKKNRRN